MHGSDCSGPFSAPIHNEMKFAVFSLITGMSIAATCALFGWLESTANMTAGLGQLFAPGATTVIFSPLLLLFILLCLGVFIAGTAFPVAITAVLGGLMLRTCDVTISQAFLRRFLIVAVAVHFIFIRIAIDLNAPFLLGRPQLHSAGPYVLATLAAAIAVLSLFAATLIVGRLTPKQPFAP